MVGYLVELKDDCIVEELSPVLFKQIGVVGAYYIDNCSCVCGII
jgi:hypothetical protein